METKTEIIHKRVALNLEMDFLRSKMSRLSDELTTLSYREAGFREMDFSEIQKLLDEGKVLEMPWNGFILKDSNHKYRQLSISKEQDSFQVWLYGAELPKETHWVKEAKNPEVLKTLLSIKDLEF